MSQVKAKLTLPKLGGILERLYLLRALVTHSYDLVTDYEVYWKHGRSHIVSYLAVASYSDLGALVFCYDSGGWGQLVLPSALIKVRFA